MKKIILASAIVLGVCTLTAPAHSTVITYNLDYEFSGADEPAGPSPWVTVTFNDEIGPAGTVNLTIDTAGLTGSEVLENLYLNFDPTLNIDLLDFSDVTGNDAAFNQILYGQSIVQADGGGRYDIFIDFPPEPGQPGSPPLFEADEIVAYTISSPEAITASSFDFLSFPAGGHGTYHAAAHIIRIGTNDGSGFIGDNNVAPPVPEPATMVLFGIGTALAGFSARRRKK